MVKDWQDRVNAQEALVRRGRAVNLAFLVGSGGETFLVRIRDGRIAAVTEGPFTMPDFAFSLKAPAEAWALFRKRLPPPGYHDLLAMLMNDTLELGGNLHAFMSNLFYFKGVMAALRERGGEGHPEAEQ